MHAVPTLAQNTGDVTVFYCVLLASTYDDDERLEESQNLLHDGVPESGEYASTKPCHLDIQDGEDGAEKAADDADQQRRSKHYQVDWDRASQLDTRQRTDTSLNSKY